MLVAHRTPRGGIDLYDNSPIKGERLIVYYETTIFKSVFKIDFTK